MSYPSIDRLVRRLRARTGIEFTPHQFRHSYVISPALNMLRDVSDAGGRVRASRVSRTCRGSQLRSIHDGVDQRVSGRAGGVTDRRRRVVGGTGSRVGGASRSERVPGRLAWCGPVAAPIRAYAGRVALFLGWCAGPGWTGGESSWRNWPGSSIGLRSCLSRKGDHGPGRRSTRS